MPRARVEALLLKGVTTFNRSEQKVAAYRDELALIHESAAALCRGPDRTALAWRQPLANPLGAASTGC